MNSISQPQKRNIAITIRLTQQEREQIDESAEINGMLTSEYARQQLLHPNSDASCGAKMQTVVRELCRSWELIEKISDPELRRNLEEWSESLWQSIK